MKVASARFTKNRHFKIEQADDDCALIAGVDSPMALIGKSEEDLYPEALAREYLLRQAEAFEKGDLLTPHWVPINKQWRYWITQYRTEGGTLVGEARDISISHPGFFHAQRLDLENQCIRLDEALEGFPSVLTFDELKIMRLYMMGYSAEYIAEKLDKSRDTIKYHIKKFRRTSMDWRDYAADEQGWDEHTPFMRVVMDTGLGPFLLARELDDWLVL